MIDTDRLIREFDLIGLASQATTLKAHSNYHTGPCPFCGGKDRFQLKTVNGLTKYFCRGCGQDRYHDALDFVMRYYSVDFLTACKMMASGGLERYETSPERLTEIDRQRQESAQREIAERTRRMQDFSDRDIAEEFHARMIDRHYRWWEQQGIPTSAARFWRLGYTPERHYHFDGALLSSPAYVIPKYDFGWQPVNVDYRLTDAPPEAGKYRSEAGLPAAVFLSRPDASEFPPEVIIVEGSKKAMVTTVNAPDKDDPPMVIGVPGKSSWCGIAERLHGVERAWVVMDPDAQPEAHRLARQIGSVARILTLPFKIDDGFTQYGFRWHDLKAAMRHGATP